MYLEDIPLPEALARLKNSLEKRGLWERLETVWIPLDDNALGRCRRKTGKLREGPLLPVLTVDVKEAIKSSFSLHKSATYAV